MTTITTNQKRAARGLPAGCPLCSIWGRVQDGVKYTDGVYWLSTAGHGGFKLDAKHNALIPAAFRDPATRFGGQRAAGWYEEDCDWAIPVWFLKLVPDDWERALKWVKDWHWRAYEIHYGVVLEPGESCMKDRDTAP